MSLIAQIRKQARLRQPVWRWMLLATLTTALIIALVCAHFYREARKTANENLAVIAELKAHEIERWLHEKRSSTIQKSSGALALAFEAFSHTPPAAALGTAGLRETFDFLLRRHPEVSRIDLYDSQGRFILSSAASEPDELRLAPHNTGPSPDLLSQWGDLDNDGGTPPHLYMFAPLSLNTPDGPRSIGTARMTLAPYRYLYPFITVWPSSNASGETLIFRVEGDEVEFLNPLQQGKTPPLTLRLPLSTIHLTPAQLQTDQTLIAPGYDYRHIEVLRAIHPVTHTSWRVIAKIDASEVYAPALRNSLIIAFLLICLLLAVLRMLQQSHQRSQESEERLRNMADNLPDSYLYQIITSPDGKRDFSHISSGVQRLHGISPADVRANSALLYNLIDPAQISAVSAEEERCHAAQCDFSMELRMRRADGLYGWFIVRSRPRPGPHNTLIWDGVIQDNTARHTTEAALHESEERLRNIAANLPASVLYQVTLEPNGQRHFTYVSASAERILGISAEAMLADMNALLSRLDPEQMPAMRQLQIDTQEGGDVVFDAHLLQPDGQWRWIAMRSRQRAQPADGRRIWDGCFTDITALKTTELQLALHARRATGLLELPVQAEDQDEAGFLICAQDLAEQLTGSQIAFIHFVNEDQESIELAAWSHKTLAHYCQAAFDRHYPISQAGIWADSARQKTPIVINDYASQPEKHGLPEGHSHLQRLISVPVLEGGLVRMIAGVGNKSEAYTDTDVESVQLVANEAWRIVRKYRAEASLANAVQVIEASPVVCFRWRPVEGWPVDYVSDNVRRWGYDPEQLASGKICPFNLIHPDDKARCSQQIEGYIAREINQYTQEYRLLQANGDYSWVSEASLITRDDSGTVLHIDSVLSDISERKTYELTLAETLAAQKALNERLEEAHNQLLQSEKLAAIGQLAAGVAHELNNPIGFVHSNLGTLTEYVTALVSLCDTYTTLVEDAQPDCPQLTEIRRIKQDQDYNYLRGDIFPLLEESREGLLRVRKIVQDLRDFSRTGSQDWAPGDLIKGLDSTLNIVANELKYKCTVKKELSDLPEVMCVISQINQVFMNLLVNAAQAIEKQGEITLRSGLEGKEHVWITISDTGKGIDAEHLNRIFEPFFTTKPVGVGTGLGLSLVFGIIARHHGKIEVTSQLGQGSTFRILLPIQQHPETLHDQQEATT